jgi:hypothetical protein
LGSVKSVCNQDGLLVGALPKLRRERKEMLKQLTGKNHANEHFKDYGMFCSFLKNLLAQTHPVRESVRPLPALGLIDYLWVN